MQIQLKQTEIISAIKRYITLQGIDLAGKDVTVAFIVGRKDNGITAEIEIEENTLPDFLTEDIADDDTATPVLKSAVLSVVTSVPVVLNSSAEPAETQGEAQTNESVKTTSLFS